MHNRDALRMDRAKVPKHTSSEFIPFNMNIGFELTRLRIGGPDRLPRPLEGQGWPNSATVTRLLCSRSLVSSCPARPLVPIKTGSQKGGL